MARRALVDANLLTLLVVGQLSPGLVANFKRTRRYDADAFALLVTLLDDYQGIVTTPNVLTEVSNLIGQMSGQRLQKVRIILATSVTVWEEEFVPSAEATVVVEYPRLGLTDAGLMTLVGQGAELITDDHPLYLAVANRGHPVLYFTHIRTAGWI